MNRMVIGSSAGTEPNLTGVIIDILTGILSGGAYGPHIPIMYGDLDKKRDLCHLVGALDFRRFAGGDGFRDHVAAMVADLHATPAAEGFERVQAPGEPEYLCSLERSKSGIPLDEKVRNELTALLP